MNFTVQFRENTGKGFNRKLRQQGFSPGIIYGIADPKPVSMRADLALRFIKSMKGATKVFKLLIEDKGKTEEKSVILQDYQLSNWGRKLIHADFLEVTDDSIVSLEVPIILINEENCPAVKTGGVIQTIRHSVPIRCAVKNIPEFIEIDVIDLEFNDSIHVLDLDYPEGVNPIVTGRNFTIITIAGRAGEEEEVEEGIELEGAAAVDGAEEAEEEKAEAAAK